MDKPADIFISYKKRIDYELALKLRYNRIITTPKDLFEKLNLTEIKSLLANSILQPLQYDFNKHAGVSLFKSYLVCKIKRKTTDKLYEKSCFVVQGYNNTKKIAFLTQATTIQRSSQRLLLSVGPTLQKQEMKIML